MREFAGSRSGYSIAGLVASFGRSVGCCVATRRASSMFGRARVILKPNWFSGGLMTPFLRIPKRFI